MKKSLRFLLLLILMLGILPLQSQAATTQVESMSITVETLHAGRFAKEFKVTVKDRSHMLLQNTYRPELRNDNNGSLGTTLTSSDVLETGKTYWLRLPLKAEEGYTADTSSLANVSNWTINGLPDTVTIQQISVENGSNGILFFNLKLSPLPESEPHIYIGSIAMLPNKYLPSNGTALVDTPPESGGYAVYQKGELYLNNFSFTGSAYHVLEYAIITGTGDLSIRLSGTNYLAAPANDTNKTFGIISQGMLLINGSSSSVLKMGDLRKSSAFMYYGNMTVTYGTYEIGTCYNLFFSPKDKNCKITIQQCTMDVNYVRSNLCYSAGGIYISSSTIRCAYAEKGFYTYYNEIHFAGSNVEVFSNHLFHSDSMGYKIRVTSVSELDLCSQSPIFGSKPDEIEVASYLNSYYYHVDNSWESYDSTAYSKYKQMLVSKNEIHQHDAVQWSTNETSHWVSCSCGKTRFQGEHDYTNDTDVECNVCSYKRPLPHKHTYGYKYNESSHWQECVDPDCPNVINSRKDVLSHSFTDDLDSDCDTCGYHRHVYKSDNGLNAYDENKHWAQCVGDNCPDISGSIKNTGSHHFDNYKDYECNDNCGYKRTIVSVGGVSMLDGSYLAVGADKISWSKPTDNYAYLKNGVLTLHNYSFSGGGYQHGVYDYDVANIYTRLDLKIQLEGTNSLTSEDMGIYAYNCKLEIAGPGTLNITSKDYSIFMDDLTISDATLKLNSMNSTSLLCEEKLVIDNTIIDCYGYFIGCDSDYISITDSTVCFTSEQVGLYAYSELEVINSNALFISYSTAPEYSDYTYALNVYESKYTIDPLLKALASTSSDGTNPESFDSAKAIDYYWVKFSRVPAKPHNIVNVVSGVHVYWSKMDNAAKYGLWRSENGKNGTYKWLGNPTVPHFTDTKVESGKTYYYKVTAVDKSGQHSEKSESIGITFVSTPDITSRFNKAAGITLGWNKINGATGYAIYRRNSNGTEAWKRVGTVTGNKTFTWQDTSVQNQNGKVYVYTIRALAGSNMKTLSGCRNTGRTMARLTSRTLNSAVKANATSIKCSWTTSSAVTGYEVRFMVGDQVYKTFTIGNYSTGVKTFNGLKSGQTYKIQVRSYLKVDSMGFYSAWSEPKTVKLP